MGNPPRKVAETSSDALARPTSKNVAGASAYKRKPSSSAQASKSTYTRKSAGVSPQTHDIHRSAGDASQPHNNKGGQNLSKKMKGVD